jgi:hypothetical protein
MQTRSPLDGGWAGSSLQPATKPPRSRLKPAWELIALVVVVGALLVGEIAFQWAKHRGWTTYTEEDGLANNVVEYEEETRSHQELTYDHSGAIGTWTLGQQPPGQALRKPAPLFKKLDESIVDQEYA